MEYSLTALSVNSLSVPPDSVSPIQATGGDISDIEVDGVAYRVHTFRNIGNDNFVVSSLGDSNGQVEFLIVAGGGGGGAGRASSSWWAGGGGGGGGVVTGVANVTPQTYTITVGAGGASQVAGANHQTALGVDGGNSVAFGVTAIGGGAGASYIDGSILTGRSGGSGGGAGGGGGVGGTATPGQGNAGGSSIGGGTPAGGATGGGGGAGQVGGDAVTGSLTGASGHGGRGIASSITGSTVFYGGGGGGGGLNTGGYISSPGGGGQGGGGIGALSISGSPSAFSNGAPNTGGGGGGVGGASGIVNTGGSGGSGIVIIRYPYRNQTIRVQAPSYIYSRGAPVQMLYYRSDERSQWSAPVGFAANRVLPLGLTITPKRSNSLIVMTWMINGEANWNVLWEIYLDSQLVNTPGYRGSNSDPANPGRWSGYVSGIYDAAGDVNSTMENTFIQYSIVANTTTTMTFYPAVRSSGATAYTFSLNRTAGAVGQDSYENAISTGVIMEIAQ
jgi:hypothetical protein